MLCLWNIENEWLWTPQKQRNGRGKFHKMNDISREERGGERIFPLCLLSINNYFRLLIFQSLARSRNTFLMPKTVNFLINRNEFTFQSRPPSFLSLTLLSILSFEDNLFHYNGKVLRENFFNAQNMSWNYFGNKAKQ